MTAKNVHQRLAAAMAKVEYIQKERKQGMQYTIVSHDAVTAKVRPALLEAGIVYYPVRCDHQHNGNRAECSMTVRFVNIDAPDDFFDVPTFGYGIDPQDKGPGKAMSYAVKYALLKALGLETGDDPEADSIPHDRSDPHKRPEPARQEAPPAQPEAPAREVADRLLTAIGNTKTLPELSRLWNHDRTADAMANMPEPMRLEVTAARNKKFDFLGGNNAQAPEAA